MRRTAKMKGRKEMKNILTAPFIVEMCETTANMYRHYFATAA
jgi:hypothetical protein